MDKRARPAIVTLRMSRSLRAALHSAAAGEGCSLNGYAVQVLAAAAGDPARFRSDAVDGGETRDVARRIERDERGFPLRAKARSEHIGARRAFFESIAAETDAITADRIVRQRDEDDPGHFVEWARQRENGAT